MSNSIEHNRRKTDNAISGLSFHWIALFKDGTRICQFDENKIEHKFQEVMDKFDNLSYFNLTNHCGKLFTVNLINGLIGYNRLEFPYIESKEEKHNIRLIYFRRVTHEIGTVNLQIKETNITYCLGCQYNDKNGNNRQITLQIDTDGNWVLGE